MIFETIKQGRGNRSLRSFGPHLISFNSGCDCCRCQHIPYSDFSLSWWVLQKPSEGFSATQLRVGFADIGSFWVSFSLVLLLSSSHKFSIRSGLYAAAIWCIVGARGAHSDRVGYSDCLQHDRRGVRWWRLKSSLHHCTFSFLSEKKKLTPKTLMNASHYTQDSSHTAKNNPNNLLY